MFGNVLYSKRKKNGEADNMTPEEKEKLIAELLKSDKIKKIYEDYIIKEIPFETWVRNTTDRLLK